MSERHEEPPQIDDAAMDRAWDKHSAEFIAGWKDRFSGAEFKPHATEEWKSGWQSCDAVIKSSGP